MEKSLYTGSGEFEFIGNLQKKMANFQKNKNIIHSIGDDCAVMHYDDGEYVHTTDVLVEGVHYNLLWSSWREVIWKSCVASLSDINAMGAKPEHMLISLGMKQGWGLHFQEEFIDEISRISQKFGVAVIGGDTVSSPISFINISMTGRLYDAPLLRSNAQPGQAIYISGTLGDSKAGLTLFEQKVNHKGFERLRKKHVAPNYPHGLGLLLAKAGAGACMDISDGLSSELHHLAEQSGVKMQIERDKIPISSELQSFSETFELKLDELWLNSGEEYELLFTIDESNAILERVQSEFSVTKIGDVLSGRGVVMLDTLQNSTEVTPTSYSHF